MMPELSLNVLDIAENCVTACAKEVAITVTADIPADLLTITIADDGKGMDAETVVRVTDPFYTTRTTRTVGLGIPFFAQAAEMTGGRLDIHSKVGEGTTVNAQFVLSSIDRMPLGDMPGTIHTLITMHEDIRWTYRFQIVQDGIPEEDSVFSLDTQEIKEILGDVSFTEKEVSQYLRELLTENTKEVIAATGIQNL